MDKNKINISLLCPTRKRPSFMKELWKSVCDTSDNINNIELIFYIDSDDIDSIDTYKTLGKNIKAVVDERGEGNLSIMWNRCYEISSGDIVMHCGDDIRFRTKGWDTKVLNKFKEYKDKIVLVYGDDGIRKDDLATHSFLHKNWVNTVGYFLPPYFSSDMNDYWLTDCAKGLDRLVKIDIITEHLHPAAGKHKWDQTHQERLARGKRDNVKQLFKNLRPKKIEDIEKLKKYIKDNE